MFAIDDEMVEYFRCVYNARAFIKWALLGYTMLLFYCSSRIAYHFVTFFSSDIILRDARENRPRRSLCAPSL